MGGTGKGMYTMCVHGWVAVRIWARRGGKGWDERAKLHAQSNASQALRPEGVLAVHPACLRAGWGRPCGTIPAAQSRPASHFCVLAPPAREYGRLEVAQRHVQAGVAQAAESAHTHFAEVGQWWVQ